jgi:hypothetical protein
MFKKGRVKGAADYTHVVNSGLVDAAIKDLSAIAIIDKCELNRLI